MGGVDYWASGVSTQLDRLLYGLLPAWLAYGLFMFVQRLLAGLFTFYLLFQYLKFDKISAILGGLLFSLYHVPNWRSGFSLYDGLAFPALGLVLFLFYRLNHKNINHTILLLVVSAFLAVGSYLAYSIFILPTIVLWFLLVDYKKDFFFWRNFSLFPFVFILVRIPAAIALLLHSPFSHR